MCLCPIHVIIFGWLSGTLFIVALVDEEAVVERGCQSSITLLNDDFLLIFNDKQLTY
jgi:hypothetical protein